MDKVPLIFQLPMAGPMLFTNDAQVLVGHFSIVEKTWIFYIFNDIQLLVSSETI